MASMKLGTAGLAGGAAAGALAATAVGGGTTSGRGLGGVNPPADADPSSVRALLMADSSPAPRRTDLTNRRGFLGGGGGGAAGRGGGPARPREEMGAIITGASEELASSPPPEMELLRPEVLGALLLPLPPELVSR